MKLAKKVEEYFSYTLKSNLKVYAVRRLWKWKDNEDDIHFCVKPITKGPFKAKILFTMNIPKNTQYLISADGTDYIFQFGKLVVPVQVKEIGVKMNLHFLNPNPSSMGKK